LLYNIYHKVKDNILLHYGLNFSIVHVLNHMDIKKGWVCWGDIPTLPKTSLAMSMKVSGILYKFITEADCILCLTTTDKKKIDTDFRVNSTVFCPYLPNLIYQYRPKEMKKILVGNSRWNIDNYIETAKILSMYKGLDITFLCAYGDDYKYKGKKKIIKDLLKNNKVTFWEDMVTQDQYKARMNTFSVYICSKKRQTGLGACNISIISGSKLYLAGVNLEHYNDLGIKVYDYKELESYSCSEDIFAYDDATRNKNYEQLASAYGKEMFIKRYSGVFDGLSK